MTVKDIKFEIQSLKSRLDAHHVDQETRRWVSAEGKDKEWILSSIDELTKMLPRASHNDDVRRFGWKSIERNA